MQLIKTKAQKGFLIKTSIVITILLAALVALLFGLQFRKLVTLEGIIHQCSFKNNEAPCIYLETSDKSFLLTQATIDKVLQTAPTVSLYDKKVRLTDRLSRQKLAVDNLGNINRFQIEKLEFLE